MISLPNTICNVEHLKKTKQIRHGIYDKKVSDET